MAIAGLGALPLPPYIAGKRATDARDTTDYQTVYAREPGAVAPLVAAADVRAPVALTSATLMDTFTRG